MRTRFSLILAAAVVAGSLAPKGARAATIAAGIPQEIRSGLFTDVNVGGFFTLGGRNSDNKAGLSSAQAYLQLGVGYDLLRWLSLGFNFGLGTSAASCFGEVMNPGGSSQCVVDQNAAVPRILSDNFTVTMFSLEAAFKLHLSERITIQPRLHLGYANLDPEPAWDRGKPVTSCPLAGFGTGIEYATHMDHFSIGVDVFSRYLIGPNIPTIAFYPKVKYTF
jgi:hypothetical protein